MRNLRIFNEYRRLLSLRTAAWLLGCLVWLIPATSLADDRPVIEVRFSIEGNEFDGLTQEDREAIRSNVESKISSLAEKQWGFLNWTQSSPDTQEVAVWNVTMKVEKIIVSTDNGGTTAGFVGKLQHSWQFGTEEPVKFDQIEEDETIYPIGSFIPFQNAVDLDSDISRKLEKQLETLFKGTQVLRYTKQIPIIDSVIADPANSRVMVPVKLDDLRTARNSVLAVIFTLNNKKGQLDLETADEVEEEGPHKGFVVGRVKDLILSPITIDTPTWWDDQLSMVIDSALEVQVFMFSYSRSWEAENGLVSEPDL